MARSFNGSTQYAQGNPIPQLVTGTVAVWVKPASLPGTGVRAIVLQWQRADLGDEAWQHDKNIFVTSSGRVVARVWDGDHRNARSPSGMAVVGNWVLVGFTVMGTQLSVHVGTVYSAATVAAGGAENFANPKLTLCRPPNSLGDGETGRARFHGDIGPVGVWVGQILTEQQWQALAAGGPFPEVMPEAVTQRFWRMLGDASPEPEFLGRGPSLVLTGSPSNADNPAVLEPWPGDVSTEDLTPDAILAASTLRDSDGASPAQNLGDLQDQENGRHWQPVNPDRPWSARLGFPTPSRALTNTQRVSVWLSTALGDPEEVTIRLYEDGAPVAGAETTVTVAGTAPQRHDLVFDATVLADPTGADVEVFLEHVPGG